MSSNISRSSDYLSLHDFLSAFERSNETAQERMLEAWQFVTTSPAYKFLSRSEQIEIASKTAEMAAADHRALAFVTGLNLLLNLGAKAQ